MAGFVLVGNLDSINRSINQSGRLIQSGLRDELREAAEPVKRDAERLSRSEISGMRRARRDPPPWSVQRIGQTVHEVYVAPNERGVKSRTDSGRRRPRFAQLLLGRAYEPALLGNEGKVRASVDAWLNKIVREV